MMFESQTRAKVFFIMLKGAHLPGPVFSVFPSSLHS